MHSFVLFHSVYLEKKILANLLINLLVCWDYIFVTFLLLLWYIKNYLNIQDRLITADVHLLKSTHDCVRIVQYNLGLHKWRKICNIIIMYISLLSWKNYKWKKCSFIKNKSCNTLFLELRYTSINTWLPNQFTCFSITCIF